MSDSTPKKALLDHYQQVQRVDEQVFLGLQIAGGHILLPILVLTILFSKRISRHPIFVTFCISWIFSSIAYSVIVYKGRSSNDLLSLNPSFNTCLIQASLLNGVQALTSTMTLSLVIHLLVLFKSFLKNKIDSPAFGLSQRRGFIYTGVLIGVPFVAFVIFTLYTLIVGSALAYNSKEQIIPDSNVSIPGVFYCVILQNADFTYSLTPGLKLLRDVYIYTTAISFSTVCLEMFIAYLVYRNRGFISERLPQEVGNWKTLFLRVVLFSIYRILSVSLNVAIIAHPDELLLVGIAKDNLYNGVIDFIQASIPLVAFLTFGSERDVLRVWMFWRKDPNATKISIRGLAAIGPEKSKPKSGEPVKLKFDEPVEPEGSAKRKLEDV
ncbi:hypothetical protein PNOK_0815900 [Pyrrhoderma noxium]|uniref:Uncharacterized protein n=1 Tax=Pyrrhoderma noxium TaxID=2282107 RepID=A0A286UAF2_9AGAM|nr:hypothetical protein PNOK_0815900 [Pyrrhoderma noxium]